MLEIQELQQEKKILLKRLMDYMLAYDKETSEAFNQLGPKQSQKQENKEKTDYQYKKEDKKEEKKV